MRGFDKAFSNHARTIVALTHHVVHDSEQGAHDARDPERQADGGRQDAPLHLRDVVILSHTVWRPANNGESIQSIRLQT